MPQWQIIVRGPCSVSSFISEVLFEALRIPNTSIIHFRKLRTILNHQRNEIFGIVCVKVVIDDLKLVFSYKSGKLLLNSDSNI
jgi:hypothetical protein